MEDFLKTYVPLILSIIVLGGHLSGWFSAAGKKAMSALEAHKDAVKIEMTQIETRHAELEKRVQSTEADLRHLPSTVDFHRIELGLTKVEGVVDKLGAMLGQVSRTTTAMDEYLRKSEK